MRSGVLTLAFLSPPSTPAERRLALRTQRTRSGLPAPASLPVVPSADLLWEQTPGATPQGSLADPTLPAAPAGGSPRGPRVSFAGV